ncbi:MAG: Stk1 family PASTA domain-containing Ser/Thr kinase [Frankia sp.]|nr:Stk1 family PASTA domain-containing Ser/Thr kinase [Frankia sp.]
MVEQQGELLGGRYALAQTLGVGGMAEVRCGRDDRLGRDVAIKVLRKDLAGDPTFLARFRREAQSAAALNHPNIVSVYDTGDDDGVPYIVMEYVEGRTLRDVLQAEGRLQPRRALEIAADICAALDYSHQAGIVHRDIKPANVMLTPAGEIKVMDFGIARAVTSSTMTQTAAVIGTAQYLSPEQARGEHVDARSDIYSTGCLLYELVTGRPPFTGESPVAVAYQHVREDAPRPSSIQPDLSPAVDAVILKAMAKNPANRYQTAGDMRDDLLRAAEGRAVAATPVLPAETTTLLTPAATTMVLSPPATGLTRRGRMVIYGVLALAFVGVFIVAALLTRSLFNGNTGGTVRTPNVTGMTLAAAEAALTKAGLKVGDVKQVFNSEKPVGVVVEQDPLPNISNRKGGLVNLFVSKGIERVRVPDVRTKSQADAEAALRAAHLKVGRVIQRDVNGVAGTVIEQTPPPGRTVNAGASVDLVVVSGSLVVPDVVGRTEAEARQILGRAGFGVTVVYVQSTTSPPDRVLSQDPAAQTRQRRGSTVTITVSQLPASPTPSESASVEPSPTPTL